MKTVGFQGHHSLHEYWSSGLLQAADTPRPDRFCPCTVLVEPNNHAVNQGILIVCIRSEGLKDLLPDTTVTLAHVVSMYGSKAPKRSGK